jgi:hypothetical protein
MALARNTAQPKDLVIYSHRRLDYRYGSNESVADITRRNKLDFSLILRPIEGGLEVYHFVGPCFIMLFGVDDEGESSIVTSFYPGYFVI